MNIHLERYKQQIISSLGSKQKRTRNHLVKEQQYNNNDNYFKKRDPNMDVNGGGKDMEDIVDPEHVSDDIQTMFRGLDPAGVDELMKVAYDYIRAGYETAKDNIDWFETGAIDTGLVADIGHIEDDMMSVFPNVKNELVMQKLIKFAQAYIEAGIYGALDEEG